MSTTRQSVSPDYSKNYLPGYTGFVPSKQERFGATAGQIRNEILRDGGRSPIMMRTLAPREDQAKRFYSPSYVQPIDKNKIIFGNHSRYAKNWIGGPNDKITPQYIPGYTGHVKGRVAENIFASSFAKETCKAIGKKHAVGATLQPKQRF